MNYRHLSLHCHCGEIPDRLAEVGFTEDHQMMIHWWCTRCKKVVYLAKPLTDCWRECPGPDHSLETVLPKMMDGAFLGEDAEFLRSIGVQA
jgi:hypothetical protein